MRYKWQTGSLAWIIHRVTGVALTLYIFLHLYVLSSLKDPAKFESIMGLVKNPFLRLSEIGLLALVVSHALNGVRLTLIDLGAQTKFHRIIFWSAFCIGSAIFLTGSLLIMGGE